MTRLVLQVAEDQRQAAHAADQIRQHDLAQARRKLQEARSFLADFKAMDPADVEVSPWIEALEKKRNRLKQKIREAEAANNHGMVLQLHASLARLGASQLTLQDKAPKAFINERHEELHAQEQQLLATIERLEGEIAEADATWKTAEADRLASEADARLRQQFLAERRQREDAEFTAWKRARDRQLAFQAGADPGRT